MIKVWKLVGFAFEVTPMKGGEAMFCLKNIQMIRLSE